MLNKIPAAPQSPEINLFPFGCGHVILEINKPFRFQGRKSEFNLDLFNFFTFIKLLWYLIGRYTIHKNFEVFKFTILRKNFAVGQKILEILRIKYCAWQKILIFLGIKFGDLAKILRYQEIFILQKFDNKLILVCV